MKRLLPFLFLLVFVQGSRAQYNYDNVLFKAVDVNELCKTLEANPGYLLLDVRSKGEHDDTSFSASLNIGRLKGARNIAVQELSGRIGELNEYRDKPVFVYCSHSQRSRRASKMLADSGFTRVYNINGGMTALHMSEDACIEKMMESSKSYNIISAAKLCELLARKKEEIFLLDVRTDSAWNQVSRFEKENGIGSLKGATHIARKDVAMNLAQIPRDKHIIITDIGGADPAFTAILLNKLGYTNISVLLEGMDRFLLSDEKDVPCRRDLYNSRVPYGILNAFEFGKWIKDRKEFAIVDVRSTDEFNNIHKDDFRNIGKLKNAINISHTEIGKRAGELEAFKSKPIIVYAFSGGPEAFIAARELSLAGYKNVWVLMGGLFNVRWLAANRKDQAFLASVVTDVPEGK